MPAKDRGASRGTREGVATSGLCASVEPPRRLRPSPPASSAIDRCRLQCVVCGHRAAPPWALPPPCCRLWGLRTLWISLVYWRPVPAKGVEALGCVHPTIGILALIGELEPACLALGALRRRALCAVSWSWSRAPGRPQPTSAVPREPSVLRASSSSLRPCALVGVVLARNGVLCWAAGVCGGLWGVACPAAPRSAAPPRAAPRCTGWLSQLHCCAPSAGKSACPVVHLSRLACVSKKLAGNRLRDFAFAIGL